MGATSAVANLAVKGAVRRARPTRREVTSHGDVSMPGSTSFPSGHTASAFAFALAVSAEIPALALPLFPLASAVGYSRVHTGVHYPGDVVAGALLGSVVGTFVPWAARQRVSGARAGGLRAAAATTATTATTA